jgi:hypothetical protein
MARSVVYCVRDGGNGVQAWRAGEVWAAADPIVKANASFFSDNPEDVLTSSVPADQLPPDPEPRSSRVEDMTAEPGRGRNVRVPQSRG